MNWQWNPEPPGEYTKWQAESALRHPDFMWLRGSLPAWSVREGDHQLGAEVDAEQDQQGQQDVEADQKADGKTTVHT